MGYIKETFQVIIRAEILSTCHWKCVYNIGRQQDRQSNCATSYRRKCIFIFTNKMSSKRQSSKRKEQPEWIYSRSPQVILDKCHISRRQKKNQPYAESSWVSAWCAEFSSRKSIGYGGTIKRTAHTSGGLVGLIHGKEQKICNVAKQLLPENALW